LPQAHHRQLELLWWNIGHLPECNIQAEAAFSKIVIIDNGNEHPPEIFLSCVRNMYATFAWPATRLCQSQ
jgi:hypothetical protein